MPDILVTKWKTFWERNGRKMGKNIFKFNKRHGIQYGFIAVCLLTIIMVVYSNSHKPFQNVNYFKDYDKIQKYNDGWTIQDGDKSFETSFPSKGELDITNNSVLLLNKLPDNLPAAATLLYGTSLQEIHVYVDNELIYEYGGRQYSAFGRNYGSIWHLITLPEGSSGKDLKIEIVSPYDEYKNHFANCYIGSYGEGVAHLAHTYGGNLIYIFITAMIGFILLIYYIFLRATHVKSAEQMLYISLLAIIASIWEFTECKLTPILVSNITGNTAANFLFLALVAIPLVLYTDSVEKRTYHKIMAVLLCALEINIVVQIILQIFGVKDFFEMMLVTHILMGLSGAVCAVTLIIRYIKEREKELIVPIVSVIVALVGGLGEIFWTYITGVVKVDFVNIAIMIVIFMTGLETVRVAFESIKESRRALEENAAKSTFLANMSHEIRTPMNAIYALSELLVNADDLSAGSRDFAKTIHSSAANLLEIINDLLDFSKITAQKYDIIDEEYELSELVSDVREMIAIRACEKELKFNMYVNPDVPYELYGDLGRIRQILLNLLNNAVKYTDEGEVSLKIDYEMLPDNKVRLIFTVSDTGIGIKESDMKDLFEAFVQVDRAKNKSKEGTGLGLAISIALAKMMHGNITVESEYGKGSTFTATVEQVIRSRKTYKKEVMDYFEKNGSLPFILVESDFETTGYYKKLLTDCGAKFVTCAEEDISDEIFLKESPLVLFTTKEHPYLFSEEFRAENPFVRAVGVACCMEFLEPGSNGEIIRKPMTSAEVYLLTKPHKVEKETISFAAPDAKVMVVDDNIVNLRVMKEILGKYEIKPTLCSNATQAVAAMELKHFDFIFMDHMMPEIDGIEATARIRALPDVGNKVKIVALTANAVKGVDKMYRENGMDGFLAKPISIVDVGKALKKHLPKELVKDIE